MSTTVSIINIKFLKIFSAVCKILFSVCLISSPAFSGDESCTKKIVSLTPDITEIAAEFVAPSCFVAVDINSNYPKDVTKAPKVADYYQINLEKLLTINNDITLVSGSFNKVSLDKISKFPKTHVFKLENFEDLFATIKETAELLKKPEQGGKRVLELKSFLNETRDLYKNAPKMKIGLLIWTRPPIIASKNTYIGELLTICGGNNISNSELIKYPETNMEQLVHNKPDLIINFTNIPLDILAKFDIPEYMFSNQDLVMRVTPRSIEEGLPELCSAVDKIRKEKGLKK